MYKNNKTRVMKPLQFHNESVGLIHINQHQVHKVVAEDRKVKMKDVFGKSAPKPKPKRKPKSKK